MPQTSFPPESKVAIGALGLLCLQSVHEIGGFCRGSDILGGHGFGAGAVILLVVYLAVLVGLRLRSRRAWWLGLLVPGALGMLCLVIYWPRNQEALAGRAAVCEMADLHLAHRFRELWLFSKIALMLMVPVALLTGKLRERLRGS